MEEYALAARLGSCAYVGFDRSRRGTFSEGNVSDVGEMWAIWSGFAASLRAPLRSASDGL